MSCGFHIELVDDEVNTKIKEGDRRDRETSPGRRAGG